MTMPLHFTKAEAAGNDLVIVDRRNQAWADSRALAIELCDRHFGIGGDGLMTIEAGSAGMPFVRMFNPDGTEDFCGNGMRCVAAALWISGEESDGKVQMQSPRGSHEAHVRETALRRFEVDVTLIEPAFDAQGVPFNLPVEQVLDYPLEVAGHRLRLSSVAVGTTHTVIFTAEEVAENLFQQVSPALELHPAFPDRTSVLWCCVDASDRIRMRIWERGVGETLSCGTGVCAAAVVGRRLGLTSDRVSVLSKGGVMSALWNGAGPVRLMGEAQLVFSGCLTQKEEDR